MDDVNNKYHMDELIWYMDKIVFIAKVGHAYVILIPWIKLGTCMKSITWMKLNALIAILHMDQTHLHTIWSIFIDVTNVHL